MVFYWPSFRIGFGKEIGKDKRGSLFERERGVVKNCFYNCEAWRNSLLPLPYLSFCSGGGNRSVLVSRRIEGGTATV